MRELFFRDIRVPRGENYFWLLIHTSDAGKKYYLHTSGIIAVKYKSGRERKLAIYINNRDNATVRVGSHRVKVKMLVAKTVFPYYKKGMCIIHRDRNPLNCDYKNLIITDNKRLGKATGHLGRSKKVKALINNEWVQFRSARECAKALHCSYQTVLNYLSSTYKSSIIEQHKVQYVEKESEHV